jgi:hypothetical protein
VVSHIKRRANTEGAENRVLKRIFGSKRNEVTGEWRTLHSEELHNLYHSQILLGRSSQGECGGWGKWLAWKKSVQHFGGKI